MSHSAEDTALSAHQAALFVLLEEFDRVCKALGIPYLLYAGTLLGAVRHGNIIPWDDDLDVLMLRTDYDHFLREAEKQLDTERFFLQKEFSEHWPMFFSKLRLNHSTCIENYPLKDPKTHHGIYIDIFPLDNAAPSSLGRRFQFIASKIVIARSLGARGYKTQSALKRAFIAVSGLLPLRPFLRLAKSKNDQSRFVHGFFAGGKRFSHCVFRREWFLQRKEVHFGKASYPIPEQFDEILTVLYGAYMTPPSEEEQRKKRHSVFVDPHLPYSEYIQTHALRDESDHIGSIR